MPDIGDSTTLVIKTLTSRSALMKSRASPGIDEHRYGVTFALEQLRHRLEHGTAWVNDNDSHAYSHPERTERSLNRSR
jgi:hypothetical protein